MPPCAVCHTDRRCRCLARAPEERAPVDMKCSWSKLAVELQALDCLSACWLLTGSRHVGAMRKCRFVMNSADRLTCSVTFRLARPIVIAQRCFLLVSGANPSAARTSSRGRAHTVSLTIRCPRMLTQREAAAVALECDLIVTPRVTPSIAHATNYSQYVMENRNQTSSSRL